MNSESFPVTIEVVLALALVGALIVGLLLRRQIPVARRYLRMKRMSKPPESSHGA